MDDTGTVFVTWDNGSSLGLVPASGDRFEVLAGDAAKKDEAPESVERPAKVEGEKPAKGKAAPAKAAKVVEPRACLCGCGFMSKARFLPGHDAKLHSLVLRIHRKKAEKSELTTAEPTLEYLETAPWMTDEIRAAVGL